MAGPAVGGGNEMEGRRGGWGGGLQAMEDHDELLRMNNLPFLCWEGVL